MQARDAQQTAAVLDSGVVQAPEQQTRQLRSRQEEYQDVGQAQEGGGMQLRQRVSARQQQQHLQQQQQELLQQQLQQQELQQQQQQQRYEEQQYAAAQQQPIVGRKREHSPGWTPMGMHVVKRQRVLRTRPARNMSALARFGKPLPPPRLDDYYEGSDFSSGSEEPQQRAPQPSRWALPGPMLLAHFTEQSSSTSSLICMPWSWIRRLSPNLQAPISFGYVF